MKNERVCWLCFTVVALLGEYYFLTSQQEKLTMVSSAGTEEHKVVVIEKAEDAIKVEEPVKVAETTSETTDESPSETEGLSDYSRGYTDGYHRATEQMQCPYPARYSR